MKTRDAERSRRGILDAAERLFSEKGFGGCSLKEIGTASGLSRAAPSYFYGSKDELYEAVLERVFADRQHETAAAMRPILNWCEDGERQTDRLKTAIATGIDGYISFLVSRPAFGRFIFWEELDGAGRLHATRRKSTALADTFSAVNEICADRGLGRFEVKDAVLLWVSLAFLPPTLPTTFMAAQDRDLEESESKRRYVDLAASQMMFLITG